MPEREPRGEEHPRQLPGHGAGPEGRRPGHGRQRPHQPRGARDARARPALPVLDGGTLGSRKHINLPGVRVNLPSITEKDKATSSSASRTTSTSSRCRSCARRGRASRRARSSTTRAAITRRSSPRSRTRRASTTSTDPRGAPTASWSRAAIWASRSTSTSCRVIQRRIVRKCAIAGKPVIVATHLLESMIHNPTPTRAEVTRRGQRRLRAGRRHHAQRRDRAPASIRCAACRCSTTSRAAWRRSTGLGFVEERKPVDIRDELARSACRLADSIDAPAIVVITRRGMLGQLVASYRPEASDHLRLHQHEHDAPQALAARARWCRSRWTSRATRRRRSGRASSACVSATACCRATRSWWSRTSRPATRASPRLQVRVFE